MRLPAAGGGGDLLVGARGHLVEQGGGQATDAGRERRLVAALRPVRHDVRARGERDAVVR